MFGSFKPKVKPAEAKRLADESAVKPRSALSDSQLSTSERHHSRDKHTAERRRSSKSRDKSLRDRLPHTYPEERRRHSERNLPADEFEQSDLFIVDKRGDVKNVEYGSLHRYSVTTHRRTGYGCLVGAPSARINRDESSEKFVILDSRDGRRQERNKKPLTSKSRRAVDPKRTRLIAPLEATAELDDQVDFVSLRPNLKRKLGAELPGGTAEDVNEVDYRSILGKAKPDAQPEDIDLRYVSDSDTDGIADPVELAIRQKNATLSKGTKDHPTDAEAWLDLIEHQARTIQPGVDLTALSHSERRTLADVRLSIYKQALKHISKGKTDHIRLLLGMIEEGTLVWVNSELASVWQRVLRENPSSAILWTKYLDFMQTNHVTFKYEQCKSAYIECLSILQAALATVSGTDVDAIKSNQIYVFLRLASFTRDSGYDEFANAMWQALLEFQFNRPSHLTSINESLDALEEFWDSDAPRIGEEGARGWLNHANTGDQSARRTQPTPLRSLEADRIFFDFASQEAEHVGKLHLPTATDDESQADDPYRYMLFSDVREVIALLLDELPASVLNNAFLIYSQLPLLPDNHNDVASSWQTDPFLRTSASGLGTQSPQDCRDSAIRTIQNTRSTTYALFEDAFESYRKSSTVHGKDSNEASRFLDLVLEALVRAQPENDILAEYWVAFKLHVFPSEVSKCAKRLLKARSSSLRLYNAYALSEAHLGRLDKARDVWSTAANMVDDLGRDAKQDAVLLWHSWFKTELAHEQDVLALRCLLKMCGDVSEAVATSANATVTAAQRLKCSSYLRAEFQQAVYKNRWDHAALYAECHMHFVYMTEGMDLDAAMQVCTAYTTRDGLHGGLIELLYQAKVGLLRIHLDRKRPYRPAMLRAELAEGIRLFPSNSACLDFYDDIDAKFPITDRIRAAVHDQANDSRDNNIVYWSHVVAREIRRCQKVEASGSTQHSVRKIFARAFQDPKSTVKHSLTLWTMWFDFERERPGEQAQQRARQVLLEGLRHLPWFKAWVIIGLQYLAADGVTPEDELRHLYHVLVERQLRIRVEAEGLLDDAS